MISPLTTFPRESSLALADNPLRADLGTLLRDGVRTAGLVGVSICRLFTFGDSIRTGVRSTAYVINVPALLIFASSSSPNSVQSSESRLCPSFCMLCFPNTASSNAEREALVVAVVTSMPNTARSKLALSNVREGLSGEGCLSRYLFHSSAARAKIVSSSTGAVHTSFFPGLTFGSCVRCCKYDRMSRPNSSPNWFIIASSEGSVASSVVSSSRPL